MSSKNSDFVKYSVLNKLDEDGKLEKFMHHAIYDLYIDWAASLTEEEIQSDPLFDVVQNSSTGLAGLAKINEEIGNLPKIEEKVEESEESSEEIKDSKEKGVFGFKFN